VLVSERAKEPSIGKMAQCIQGNSTMTIVMDQATVRGQGVTNLRVALCKDLLVVKGSADSQIM